MDQTSDCGDCVMVNGEASITVKINPSQYGKEEAKLNLSRIRTFAKEPCGFEDLNTGKAKAFNSSLNGCATINTIKDFPTVNAPDDIPEYPFDLKEASSFFGHVLVGENATKMKAFYKYLEEGFWEDAKDFAYMFVPFAGSIDGFVKAANKCSEEGGCDVNGLILSGVAAIAESTLGGRAIVKTLGATFKGIYKLGKMAVDSPGGKALVDGFTVVSQELRQLGGLTAEVVAEKYGQALATTLEGFQKYGGNKYVKRAGEIANHIKATLGKPIKEAWEEFVTKFKPRANSNCGSPGSISSVQPQTSPTCNIFRNRAGMVVDKIAQEQADDLVATAVSLVGSLRYRIKTALDDPESFNLLKNTISCINPHAISDCKKEIESKVMNLTLAVSKDPQTDKYIVSAFGGAHSSAKNYLKALVKDVPGFSNTLLLENLDPSDIANGANHAERIMYSHLKASGIQDADMVIGI
jgi:hypothetical protein